MERLMGLPREKSRVDSDLARLARRAFLAGRRRPPAIPYTSSPGRKVTTPAPGSSTIPAITASFTRRSCPLRVLLTASRSPSVQQIFLPRFSVEQSRETLAFAGSPHRRQARRLEQQPYLHRAITSRTSTVRSGIFFIKT